MELIIQMFWILIAHGDGSNLADFEIIGEAISIIARSTIGSSNRLQLLSFIQFFTDLIRDSHQAGNADFLIAYFRELLLHITEVIRPCFGLPDEGIQNAIAGLIYHAINRKWIVETSWVAE
jgi:hypothetical protein